MKFRSFASTAAIAMLLLSASAEAAVVGQNVPVEKLSPERIQHYAGAQAGAWADYIKASEATKAADHAALDAERQGLGVVPAPVPEGNAGRSMPLDRDAAWYATPEARHVADVIVSFQTPAGGWGKNAPRDGQVRQKGQAYVAQTSAAHGGPSDFDFADMSWHYVGTFDNDATITELRFLARVQAAVPGPEGDVYRQSLLRGIRYTLAAQFPNGGWPQVYPLEGGYHDAITYNDDALDNIVSFLKDVARGEGDYAFAPDGVRTAAAKADAKALDVVLKTQVRIGGKLTVWGQQHDALTLEPVSARNFEPPSLSAAESATLLVYLMRIDSPSPEVKASIRAGVQWLKDNALHDVALVRDASGRHLQAQPGAPLLWSRYYDLKTGKPIFGDRDKSIHDDMMEISAERRNGYSWYNTTPQKALNAYAKWEKAFPGDGG
ncbi:pectate lyase [Asticcacaulis solisilvae]|uniref:pectate lyase n=1 Tax=Asticcacaulis solisilvae TaxID=1217274 RepID=UPI003FD70D75